MSNGVNLRESALDLRRQLTEAQAELAAIKAQGVLLPEQVTDANVDQLLKALEWRADDDARADAMKVFNHAIDEVARLNAAPVQQVRVPDVSAMARTLADRNADACNVNREDNWAIYGQDYIDDVTAMLAAQAAPAAGAGASLIEWTKDAVEWGGALNYAAWEFINECPKKSALLFNNTKGPLRAAIMKYAELVSANVKDSSHD